MSVLKWLGGREMRKSRAHAQEPRNHNKRQGCARAREADHSNNHSRERPCAHCKFTVENQDLWGLMWGQIFFNIFKILFLNI